MEQSIYMHHVQKSIILSLARTSPLRFTQLQPPRTANNIFSYHLKKLVGAGYIESTDKGYVLTRKALKLVVFGAHGYKTLAVPQTISMIYVENNDGEVLLLNRNHQPFQGWYGVPAGLVHVDETLDEAANRELAEKTTLAAAELTPVGVLDFRYAKEKTGDIFLHFIAFVYAYKFTGNKKSVAGKVTRYGQLSWSSLDGPNILPEVYVIKKLVNAHKFGITSVSFEEPALFPVLTN